MADLGLRARRSAQSTLVAACTASLAVWVAVMTWFMVRTPAGDFSVYRNLSPAALGAPALYDVRIGPLAFTYPAFAALPLSLLSKVSFGLGLTLLTLVSMAALARTVVVLARSVVRERVDALPVSTWTLVLAFLAVAVWFAPVTKTLMNGQLNLVLVWLVVEDVLGDVPPRWRGVLTGLATGLKLTPGLFVLTMLVTGRKVWALRAVATFAVTVAIGFLVEPRGSFDYWRHLGRAGDGYGHPIGFGNQSVMYAMVRLVGDVQYAWFLPLAVGVVALALTVAVRLHRQGHELATWGVTAIAMLAATPISWAHHWVWMLLPLAALVAMLPLRASGRGVLLISVLVLWSGATSIAPHLHLDPLGNALITQPLGNAYLLVGLGVLLWFAALAFASPKESDADVIDLSEVDAKLPL